MENLCRCSSRQSPCPKRAWLCNPSDFKGKVPSKVSTVREWSIQSYVSKDSTSLFCDDPDSRSTSKPIQMKLRCKSLYNFKLLKQAKPSHMQNSWFALKVSLSSKRKAHLSMHKAIPHSLLHKLGQYLIQDERKSRCQSKT